MKKIQSIPILSIIFTAFSIIYFACGKPQGSSPSKNYLVKIAYSPTLNNHLVDKDGYTLYWFADDCKGQTTCLTGCKEFWPYFFVDSLKSTNLGPGLSISDFDTIMVNGTTPQIRYKGWPLYYYSPKINNIYTRESPGQTTGEAVGGIWFVAKTNYSIMLAHAQLIGHNGIHYVIKGDTAVIPGEGKTIYFTDSLGITLYINSNDSTFKNKWTNPSFSNDQLWPIYQTSRIVVPSVLNGSPLSVLKDSFTIKPADTLTGKFQLSYNGWPLYKNGSDGITMGNTIGVADTLRQWFVAWQSIHAYPQKPKY